MDSLHQTLREMVLKYSQQMMHATGQFELILIWICQ